MPTQRQQCIAKLVKNEEDFAILRSSGMFWEWFPECDGTYENFVELYKQKEEK